MTQPYRRTVRPYGGPRLCLLCAYPLDPMLATDLGQRPGTHPNCAALPDRIPGWMKDVAWWVRENRPEALQPPTEEPPK